MMPRKKADPVAAIVAELERRATVKHRDGLARFAIPADKAFGVPVGTLHLMAKRLARSHALAAALWETEIYEARLLACFVDEHDKVTPKQMEQWCRDFDSWAVCDTACFHLFDRTPHAWAKVRQWATRKPEFQKRAAFALLASLCCHDKASDDGPFAESLPLIERAADDDRNFVKKGVNWALRCVGKRSRPLNALAVALSRKLADSKVAAERWVGKDALRELTAPKLQARLAKR